MSVPPAMNSAPCPRATQATAEPALDAAAYAKGRMAQAARPAAVRTAATMLG